jgi:hypothetical protein
MRRSIPIGGPGITPRQLTDQPRRWPPSWSARPAGPRRAAGSPPRPRSSSAPPRSHPSPPRRAQRALAAAQAKYGAGAFDDALALLAMAEAGALGDLERAGLHRLRAQIAFASRRDSDAPPLLLQAARELEAVDPNLARATYLEALSATMFAGRLARGGGAVEISEAALAGPPPPAAPRPSDLLLQGLAVQFTAGYAAGAPIIKEALRAFRQETVLPPQEARWLWFASWVALHLWDDEAWTVLSTRHLELVREAGALTALPFVLTNRSSVYAWSGELAVAASLEEELRAATEATGIAPVPYGASRLQLCAVSRPSSRSSSRRQSARPRRAERGSR